MGYIYKFQNLINNKIYIGQTSRSPIIRYKEHTQALGKSYDSQKNSIFHKALIEYGVNNFSFEVIEECKDADLNEREKYWITYYNSYHNGYNMNEGGESPFQIYDKDLIKKLWDEGKTQEDILKIVGCCGSTLRIILNELQVDIKERIYRGNLKRAKAVEQYSLNGEYIQTFNSIADAAKSNNLATVNIARACMKKLSSAGKYIWKYENDDTPVEEFVKLAASKEHHRNRKVDQYTLDGRYIRTFNTLTEAKNYVGAKSVSSIVNACTGRSSTAFGYVWKYN